MTIQFPDLSHYKPVSLDGAVALITKGTQGSSYVDPTFAPFRADAAGRGIPFCGYHWVDTSDITAQAANAWRVMGSTPVMWDAEAAGVTVPRLFDLTARFRALGGKPTLCYLPRWWWRDHMGSPDLRPLAAAGLSLVSSAYPSTGYTEDGVGWQPYGGVTPVIWQWTDAKWFNGQQVDFNAYKGTVEQLRALFNGTEGDDDMTPEQSQQLAMVAAYTPALAWRVDAIQRGLDTVQGGPYKGEAMWVVQAIKALDRKLSAIGTGDPGTAAILAGIDADMAKLQAALEAEIRDAVADLGEGGAAQVRADA